MACNSCNNLRSEVAGILFPDFVSHSCCNPCCSGSVGGTSTGCGCNSCNSCGSCGTVGGSSSGNCTCGCNAYGCGCACD